MRMTEDQYLLNQTKEQLIIFIRNGEYQIDSLHQRMKQLTGCAEFGNLDGMNGQCVECSYEDPELFNKCWNFEVNGNV